MALATTVAGRWRLLARSAAPRLGFRLTLTDAAASAVGVAGGQLAGATVGVDDPATSLLLAAGFLVVRPFVARGLGLHARATARLATVEMVGLAKLCVGIALLVLATAAVLGIRPDVGLVAGTSILTFGTLSVGRQVFRDWVDDHRRRGDAAYATTLVGTPSAVAAMAEVLEAHPSVGNRPVAAVLVTDPDEAGVAAAEAVLPSAALPPVAAHRVADLVRSDGVLVLRSGLDDDTVATIVRSTVDRGHHVHLHQGLSGVAPSRLQHDPLLTDHAVRVQAHVPGRLAEAAKRGMDVVGAVVGLVLAAPLVAVAAVAIRMTDGGPVLFRQERVGRDGRPITVAKLRTMCVDAEERKAALEAENARSGPLFKMAGDPRVTRVGRILRASSLDEVPQLVAVLRGDMSLVGPRPALPSEVATFDPELRERERVRPGVTGLWQVEARDEESFELYRRFDLFYVHNWSVGLDLVIVLRTIVTLLVRPFRVGSAALD